MDNSFIPEEHKLLVELKFPDVMSNTAYIPVYTYDGISYKGLDITFNLPSAKSRLKSVIPDAWRLNMDEFKDQFKNLRCGIAIIDLKTGISSATWVEFVPNDLNI